jgi:hypothetical protein
MEKLDELAKAVIKVMQTVKGMEKNSKVGSGSVTYDGTKYSDVAEKFNEVMSENGLCILPTGIEESTKVDRWDEIDPWSKLTPKATKQKQSVFTTVKTKYLLLHISGQSTEIAGYGHGVDPQDKGAGKATTYAIKNALLYTFLTPVGKMDDSELTHSDDITIPGKTKTEKPAPKKEEPVKSPKVKKEDLPWLKTQTPEWDMIVNFLTKGYDGKDGLKKEGTIKLAKERFQISELDEKELIKIKTDNK